MPKKKSKTEEKKDKILEEVAAKLKSIEDEKESELEKDTEINLNSLREMEFSQFIPSSEPSEDRAPVLERIAGSQPRPIFVGGIPQTSFSMLNEEEKTDESKYVPGRAENMVLPAGGTCCAHSTRRDGGSAQGLLA